MSIRSIRHTFRLGTRNGTIFSFIILAFYFVLAVSIELFGWYAVWPALYVDTLSETFGDIRLLQGAVISLEMGFDPTLENPGYAKGTLFNHPPIWLTVGQVFRIDQEPFFLAFTIGFLSIFVLILAAILNRFPSFTLLLASVSGAALMAVERGNNDVIVFDLVVTALLFGNRWIRAALFLFAAILKLYPLAGFAVLLPRQKLGVGRNHLPILTAVALFIVYFAWLRSQILFALSVTHEADVMSFGVPVLVSLFDRFFPNLEITELAVVSLSLVSVLAAIPIVGVFTFRSIPASMEKQDLAFDLFLAGSGIFTVAYLCFNNWDYRLIFVILVVPYVLRETRFPLGIVFSAALLLSLNQFLLVELFGAIGGALNIIAKAVLHTTLAAMLLRNLWGIAMGTLGADLKVSNH